MDKLRNLLGRPLNTATPANDGPEAGAAGPQAGPLPPPGLPARGKLRRLREAVDRLRDAPLLQTPLGLYSRMGHTPARPDVNGPSTAQPALPTLRPMGPKRTAAMDSKLAQSVQALQGPVCAAGAAPNAVVLPLNATTNDVRCRAVIDAMFNTPAAGAAPTLGNALLASLQAVVPAGPRAAQDAREAALHVALALRTTFSDNPDPARAQAAWRHLAMDPPGLAAAQQRDVNDVLRTLAANDVAFDAAWAVMRGNANHRLATRASGTMAKEQLQCALQATARLAELGIAPANPALACSLDDFAVPARLAALGQPALGGKETPQTLAARTLTHLLNSWAFPTAPADPQGVAAYTAWRNGFRESGPGSDFNQAVHRLHKFTTWVRRGTTPQGQGGAKRFLQGAKHSMQAMVGKRLSPLDAARHGTVGAELRELPQEQQRFAQALRGAVQTTQAALTATAARLRANPLHDPRQLQACQIQQAILAHWDTTPALQGRNKITLDAAGKNAVRQQLQNQGVAVNDGLLQRLCSQRLDLKTLESWGHAVLAADANPARATLDGHLQQARHHAKAPYARVQTPVTSENLRQMVQTALDTEGVQFRSGGVHGVDMGANLGFATPVGVLGAGVGPSLRLTTGRQATVRVGTRTVGSDIFIGTERRGGGTLSLAGTVGVSLSRVGDGALSAAGQLGGRYGTETAEGTGVCIRVSKNVPQHRQLAGQVVNFLFNQANLRATGTAIDAPTLWENFATRFAQQPEVSMNFVGSQGDQRRGNVGAAGGLRLGYAPFTAGLMFSGGYEYSSSTGLRRELNGVNVSQVADKTTRSVLSGGLSLQGQVVPSAQVSGAEPLQTVRFPALSLGSLRQDLELDTQRGQVRLTIENGRVQPHLSLLRRDFGTSKDFARHMENQRMQWHNALAGHPQGGQAAFDEFMQQAVSLPTGGTAAADRIFTERRCLTPEAADTLNFLLPQRQLLQALGPAGAAQGAQVDAEVSRVLNSPQSWNPEKLAVSEVASITTELGLDALAVVRARWQATSENRYLLQLKPRAAQPPQAGDSAPQAQAASVPPQDADEIVVDGGGG